MRSRASTNCVTSEGILGAAVFCMAGLVAHPGIGSGICQRARSPLSRKGLKEKYFVIVRLSLSGGLH